MYKYYSNMNIFISNNRQKNDNKSDIKQLFL